MICIRRRHDAKPVVLVTKDVNMRMKAKALGIPAEDYTTDRVRSIDALYSGKEIVEDVDDDSVNALYQAPFELPAETRVASTNSS